MGNVTVLSCVQLEKEWFPKLIRVLGKFTCVRESQLLKV